MSGRGGMFERLWVRLSRRASARGHVARWSRTSRQSSIALEALEPRVMLSAVHPTGLEQYMLELINLARADPAAYAARLNIDLNEGLTPGAIGAEPKQPLTLNPYLTHGARLHSQWMIEFDVFSHTGDNGSSPTQRMSEAGYVLEGAWRTAENVGWRGTTGALNVLEYVRQIDAALFIDEGIDDRGHRLNVLNPALKEVGIGIAVGNFSGYNAVMITQDFASSGTASYLTGVAYDDRLVLRDQFYTPGEGLANVAVIATRQSDQAVFTTTTFLSGGYMLALPPGVYDVEASGPGMGGGFRVFGVVMANQNVKLDLAPTPAGSAALPVLSITALEAQTLEGGAPAIVRISRVGALDQPLTVKLQHSGTAKLGADYTLSTGRSIIIPAGEDHLDILVVARADRVVELLEELTLMIAPRPQYLVNVVAASAVVWIVDNSPMVSIHAVQAEASEDGTPAIFNIRRSGPTDQPLTVRLRFHGTASAGQDYVGASAKVTIPAGADSMQLILHPLADRLVEPTETLRVTLRPSRSYSIDDAAAHATATIADVPVRPSGADLLITWVNHNQQITGASSLSVMALLRNQGMAGAGIVGVGLRLSADRQWGNEDDIEAGYLVLPGLAEGEKLRVLITIELSAPVPTGDYFLLARLDLDDANPWNNLWVSPTSGFKVIG